MSLPRPAPFALRGTGRTTEQLRNAPKGAIYVCLNSHTISYTKHLAHRLGREDLRFESPDFFAGRRWKGITKPVVVDHAFWEYTSGEAADYALEALRLLSLRFAPDSHRPS